MVEPKKTFYCPHCGQKLSFLDGTMVKMEGLLESPTFTVRTQFFIPAELGRYGAIVAGNVELREGARVEFFCINARCAQNFTALYNPELAEIRMVDETGRDYVVVFNKIFGRRATFLVDRKARQLLGSFGEHAAAYAQTFERPLNYFGA
jgi:hypothetical protein